MKYKIIQTDRRYKHNELFQYYIEFSSAMVNSQGPLNFTRALKWFTETYGWTTEVALYQDITRWAAIRKIVPGQPAEVPAECNPRWSWGKDQGSLRIYIATDSELAFFCMAHPLD